MHQSAPPPPQPDPALEAQVKLAETAQQKAVSASLSSDMLNMLRLFGQSNAMSGAGVTMPMASITGTRGVPGVQR